MNFEGFMGLTLMLRWTFFLIIVFPFSVLPFPASFFSPCCYSALQRYCLNLEDSEEWEIMSTFILEWGHQIWEKSL